MSTLSVDTIQGKTTSGTVAMPPGMIVQVQTDNLSTFSTSSATMASMGTLAITPKFSSSIILVQVQVHLHCDSYSSTDWRAGLLQIKRDTTSLETDEGKYGDGFVLEDNNDRWMTHITRVVYDTPSTTSAISYGVFASSLSGRTNTVWNTYGYGKLHAMEIKQ